MNGSKRTIQNNVKWDTPLHIWIALYSNRVGDDYRTWIFSAVFWFLAAFVSLFQISSLIESKLNISVPEVVRLLVVIILLAGSLAVDHHHSSLEIPIIQTSSGSYNTTQGDNVHYWNWSWNETSHTEDMKVTSEYESMSKL